MSNIMGEDIPPDHRFLFKPIPNAQSEGCHMDVWLPKTSTGKAAPLAIFIHGGAFSHGSTKDIGFNQVQYFLDNGVAVVSLEYRLSPQATNLEQRSDILDAYIYIQAKLNSALGGTKPVIDIARCLVTGGSAGGTSSLFLPIDIEIHNKTASEPLPRLKAVLAGYGSVDPNSRETNPRSEFEKQIKPTMKPEDWVLLSKLWDEPVCCSDPYQFNVIDPIVPRRPRNLWVQAGMKSKTLFSFLHRQDPPFSNQHSVIDNVTSTYPPTHLYCSMEDDLVPAQQWFRFQARLQELGVECNAPPVKAPHGFIDLPGRYFPDRVHGWWDGYIKPALDWALIKLDA